VPRKSGTDVFQEDIYPDTYAGKPALSADEWLSGTNKDPIMTTMDPEKKEDDDSNAYKFEKKKTYQELEEENKALKARVKELEAQLGIKGDDEDAANNEEEANYEEEQKEEAE